jgi:hypothetical protein
MKPIMKPTLRKKDIIANALPYVWVALLIVFVAGALLIFLAFNTLHNPNNQALGFTQVKVPDFKLLSDGTLYVKLENGFGAPIKVGYINATLVSKSGNKIGKSFVIALDSEKPSEEVKVGVFPSSNLTAGEQFSVELTVAYKDKYDINYAQYGTLVGTVN